MRRAANYEVKVFLDDAEQRQACLESSHEHLRRLLEARAARGELVSPSRGSTRGETTGVPSTLASERSTSSAACTSFTLSGRSAAYPPQWRTDSGFQTAA